MQNTYLLLVFLMLCVVGCSPAGEDSSEMDTGKEAMTTEKAAAQALLLTQDFAYDAEDKNRMTGDYKVNKRVVIPGNLSPQNKWIMFEGPVLENDKIAYRYYADSRHRFDIYGKTVADLVMDTISWQYHDIMNWGSDILKVGNSLGMGSPGIWYQDSIYTLSDCSEKVIEVIETGGDKAVIRTTFKDLTIGSETFDLVQDWSIMTGNYWSQIDLSVQNGELPEGMSFATGIVKHLPEIEAGEANDFTYLYNWGKQSYHKEQMGMAVLAANKFGPRSVADELSHLLVFDKAPKTVSYRFLAGWERDQSGVKTADAFMKTVVDATK